MNKPEQKRVRKRTISVTPEDDVFLVQLMEKWEMRKISQIVRRILREYREVSKDG